MKLINGKDLGGARLVALVGIMAATVECGKLVLSFLPNIEVVTLLLALFGYVFGWAGVVFMLLRRVGVKNRWVLTATAVGLTFLFGVLSSLIDCAVFLGVNENYFSNLLLYYLRGVVFYAVQIACNAVLFSTVFLFICSKLERFLVNKSQ